LLDYFLNNIPTNPLAWLEKNYVNKYRFNKPSQLTEMKRRIVLEITEKDGSIKEFFGYGKTKKQCKLSAAKRAMMSCMKRNGTLPNEAA